MSTVPPAAWPAFNLTERRVLGVLVEKAKTTPDAYPMSVNALVTGSNQKSNRDPVLNLTEDDVEETLIALQGRRLTTKIISGRVDRWKHNLYDVWQVEKVDLAVLGELLLRGPQSEGELRTRASRMEPISDLDQLRAVLRPLRERGLIVFLGPEGRRGTLISDGFLAPGELDRLRQQSRHDESAAPAVAPTGAAPSALEGPLHEMKVEMAALRTQLQQLQQALAEVQQQVRGLKEALGA